MCKRFASAMPPERLRAVFMITGDPVLAWAPRWNVAPGASAPVVRRAIGGARTLDLLGWGFSALAPAADDERRPFNARAETIHASRLFGDAFRERRCLVPVTAFYEWRQAGAAPEPWAFARMDGRPVALGGVWNGDGFAVLTVDAGAPIRAVHDRAPLILEEADWPLWLGETAGDPDRLLRPAPATVLRAWPVGRAVDHAASDGARLLDPID